MIAGNQVKRCIFFFTGLFLCVAVDGKSTTFNIDSLVRSISGVSDSSVTDSLIKLARHYVINEQPLLTITVAREALTRCNRYALNDLRPKARFYLAAGFDETHQFDSSLFHYEKALVEMEGTAHADWRIHVFKNISHYLGSEGQYEQSLYYKLKVLEILESEKDTFGIGRLYTDIGYIYDRMKQFEESIEWQRKAIALFKQLQEGQYGFYIAHSRIGIAYDDLGLYDSAHYYNSIALNGFRSLESKWDIPISLSNIGNTYSKQKKWKAAQEHLEEALRLNAPLNDRITEAIAAINLGYVYMEQGKYQQAKESIMRGMKSARLKNEIKFLSEGNYRMYQLHEQQGKADSALAYYKAFKSLEDTLYNLERSRQIAALRTQYETDKKQQLIDYQELEIQETQSALAAKRNLNGILGLTIGMVVLLFIVFFYRFRVKKEAELQQVRIDEQEKGMKAILSAQEEERKRISKDLHDGIGQELSGLKLGLSSLSESIADEQGTVKKRLTELIGVLSKSADEVRAISHQMMPRALTELGLVSAIEDMLEKSLGSSSIAFEFEQMNMKIRLPERIEVSLYRVCQELINNVIKHSGASKVHVQLFQNKGKVIMIVEDNGTGIATQPASEGHGLMNIKSRVSTLNGEVNYERSAGSGTLATVRIPIS